MDQKPLEHVHTDACNHTDEAADLIKQAVDTRTTMWSNAVEGELQHLLTEAARIRKNINESKTGTKKAYYQKKFDKVRVQVMQMVAALQRLKTTDGSNEYNNGSI